MTLAGKIPIENIYYLLVYAWDCLEESARVDVSAADRLSLLDLLADVLANGISHLFKRGLDRGYATVCEESAAPRGRIDLNRTISRRLQQRARLFCRYDEFSYDVRHNQILKATLGLLLKAGLIDRKLSPRLALQQRRLAAVSDITLSGSDFRRVQLHSNNRFYAFLLQICELIRENLLLSEAPGSSKFQDFLRDDAKMRHLFEKFVHNFYRREQKVFKVAAEQIEWGFRPLSAQSARLLPRMRTDISLTSPKRKTIIDTKFTDRALTHHFGKESLVSSHIYQLQSYLRHSPWRGPQLEGILLYPTVDQPLSSDYQDAQFTLRVRTINLAQSWQGIKAELLGLMN